MTTGTTRLTCVLLAIAPAAHADEAKDKMAGKGQVVSVNAKDIQWSDAPADLPKGAKMAVLSGDPTKPGLFAVRLKVPDGYKIPPHWHTQSEELTVLAGQVVLHMGDSMQAEPHVLDVDGYHFLPGKMHHAAEFKGDTVVQLQGMGPFDIHYLNPADNPNPKHAAR